MAKLFKNKSIALGDVVDRVERADPAKLAVDEFMYVDLGSVDQRRKVIRSAKSVMSAQAPSRARQRLKSNDVLVSTVRPNLNGVARVPNNLDGAIASTGFCVLRPRADELDPHYLFHWVRSPGFVSDMTSKATGASYPAVSDKAVLASYIPYPPLCEQKRIAAILDSADQLRTRRNQAITHLEALVQSLFHATFGDPVLNERGWDPHPVSDFILGANGGKNLVGAVDEDGGYRVLKISAITSLKFNPAESKPLPTGYVPPDLHLLRDGDLLFSRANTSELVGATVLIRDAPEKMALPDKIWRLEPNPRFPTDPRFVEALFQLKSFRAKVSALASGSSGSMKNISKPKLFSIEVGVPPFEVQLAFGNRVEAVARLMDASRRQLLEFDALFASLQDRAFRGEL